MRHVAFLFYFAPMQDREAPLFARDDRKQTLAHAAARVGNTESLQILAEKGKEMLDMRDRWARTPLHWAVSARGMERFIYPQSFILVLSFPSFFPFAAVEWPCTGSLMAD